MDVLDREILFALQQEGRQTSARLAEALALSASAIRERVRRRNRKGDGLVRGFHADVAFGGLGVGLRAFVTGRFDYLLHVAVRDLAHLGRPIKTDIAAISGVAKLETLLALTAMMAGAGWPAFDDG